MEIPLRKTPIGDYRLGSKPREVPKASRVVNSANRGYEVSGWSIAFPLAVQPTVVRWSKSLEQRSHPAGMALLAGRLADRNDEMREVYWATI